MTCDIVPLEIFHLWKAISRCVSCLVKKILEILKTPTWLITSVFIQLEEVKSHDFMIIQKASHFYCFLLKFALFKWHNNWWRVCKPRNVMSIQVYGIDPKASLYDESTDHVNTSQRSHLCTCFMHCTTGIYIHEQHYLLYTSTPTRH